MPHEDGDFKLGHEERIILQNLAGDSCSMALGKLLMEFQGLEQWLTRIAGYLLDPDDFQVGILVTSEMPFRGVLNLVYSLAQHRKLDPELVESLRECLKGCSSVEQRRNNLIHSYWTPEPETVCVTRYKYTAKFPRGYKPQVEKISAEEIYEVIEDIMNLTGGLIGLMDLHDIEWGNKTTFPNPHDVTSSLLPRNLRPETESELQN